MYYANGVIKEGYFKNNVYISENIPNNYNARDINSEDTQKPKYSGKVYANKW